MSRMARNGTCFDPVLFPWEKGYPDDFDSIGEAFQSINWTAHSHTKYINIDEADLRKRTWKLRNSTDKAIVMSGGAKLLELGFFLRRMDNLLMDLMADHGNLSKLLDKLMELHMAGLEKKIRAVGDLVDVIRFGDDLGYKTSTLLKPDDIKKFIIPEYKKIIDIVHSYGKDFLLHCCGNIFNVMEDIITEAGIDVKHSNEDAIAPFTTWLEKYGDRIGNFGGVDMDVLCQLSEEGIRSYTLDILEKSSGHGGVGEPGRRSVQRTASTSMSGSPQCLNSRDVSSV